MIIQIRWLNEFTEFTDQPVCQVEARRHAVAGPGAQLEYVIHHEPSRKSNVNMFLCLWILQLFRCPHEKGSAC